MTHTDDTTAGGRPGSTGQGTRRRPPARPRRRSRRTALLGALATLLLAVVVLVGPAAGATTASAGSTRVATDARAAGRELGVGKAAVLGLVEGLTEYLPISSTGHLVVAERLLDVGQHRSTKEAMDSYTVVIQLGAILAVLVLYRRRVGAVLAGVAGRDPDGLRLLRHLAIAFLPAAVVGVALSGTIDDHLLAPAPVAAAWIAGGLAILLLGPRHAAARSGAGLALEQITDRQALLIGVAQALALWPGVSRSLVTILAATLLGISLPAAVEFSFLLGLGTLGAATGLELVTHGSDIVHTYGIAVPLVGIVVAALAALVAVRWMVTYLARHDLEVFGQYRIVIGLLTLGALLTGIL